jgi:hypothetical protein
MFEMFAAKEIRSTLMSNIAENYVEANMDKMRCIYTSMEAWKTEAYNLGVRNISK